MAKIDSTSAPATPAYVALLRSRTGATSKALQEVMGRKYAPTMYQLAPIAERLGFAATSDKGNNGLLRYRFVAPATKPAKAKPAKAAPVAKKSAIVTAKKPARKARG